MIVWEIVRNQGNTNLIYVAMDVFLAVNVLTKYSSRHRPSWKQKCKLLKNMSRLQQDYWWFHPAPRDGSLVWVLYCQWLVSSTGSLHTPGRSSTHNHLQELSEIITRKWQKWLELMEPHAGVWLVGRDDGSLSFSGMLKVHSMAHYFLSRMKAYVSQRKNYKGCRVFLPHIFVGSFFHRYELHCPSKKPLSINLAAQMWAYLIATTDLGGCMKP